MSAHEPRLTGTKVCTSCKRELHVLAFAVHKQCSDGLHPVCRECRNIERRSAYIRKKGKKDKTHPNYRGELEQ